MTAGLAALIDRLKRNENLEPGQMRDFLTWLGQGELSDHEIAAFLLALKAKGESVAEITEAARVMRGLSVEVPIRSMDLLDTCGTGGDGLKTLNVSTLTALVAAAAGIRVAKHGNRAVTSHCGSADLLEDLGVRIDLKPKEVAACIEKTGFGFIFAPLYHPVMKMAAPARKKIKERTLFNCLGPLTNPAKANCHLMGVYDVRLVQPLCQALGDLGAKRAIVVHGENGLDEASLCGTTYGAEWTGGRLETSRLAPEDLGLRRVSIRELQCENREKAVETARGVLRGETGPATDFVLLNAAFALKAGGITDDAERALGTARRLLAGGLVLKKLEEIKMVSQSL